jgi:hypothetical protein
MKRAKAAERICPCSKTISQIFSTSDIYIFIADIQSLDNAGGQWQPGLPQTSGKDEKDDFKKSCILAQPWLSTALPGSMRLIQGNLLLGTF